MEWTRQPFTRMAKCTKRGGHKLYSREERAFFYLTSMATATKEISRLGGGPIAILSQAVPSLSPLDHTLSDKPMAPSGLDKRRTVAGVGLATSVLLSPHNPKQTAIMGLGKFFTLPSSSSSSSNSSRPQASYRPPPSPGSSKIDDPYGPDLSDPSVPKWSAQNYPPCNQDAPPAYSPKNSSDHNDWATDFKMPVPQKPYDGPAHLPIPSPIQAPTNSQGEDPLRQLKYYDIVIILDDSWSMTKTDKHATKSRWNQVSDGSLPLPHTAIVMAGSNRHTLPEF